MSDLHFLNEYNFINRNKNAKQHKDNVLANKKHTVDENYQLGKKQPYPFDYPYLYNLKNLYGNPKYNVKGLSGSLYNTPFTIRPPNKYIDNRQNEVLNHMKNRKVEVSGYKYNINELPNPPTQKISF